MKIKSIFLLLFGVLILSANSIVKGKTANLTINVSGLKEIKGGIQLGLYNESASFPKPEYEFMVISILADSSSVTYTIPELPVGEYAIALYHDINSDKACNKNWIGIPTEAYGFSNNVRVIFSAPSFEKTKFSLIEDSAINVKLKH